MSWGPAPADLRRLALLIGIYLATRVPALIGFAAAQRTAGEPISVLAAQERWDGWWYLYLAEYGYPDGLTIEGRDGYGPWGFFPAWPMLIRFVARVGIEDYRLSGLILSTLCGIALTIALYRLASNWTDHRAALWTVTLFLASPGTVVMALPYTEALFLLLAVVAIDAMVRGQWWLASAATLGACSVRSTGFAIVVAGIVAYALQLRDWRRKPAGSGRPDRRWPAFSSLSQGQRASPCRSFTPGTGPGTCSSGSPRNANGISGWTSVPSSLLGSGRPCSALSLIVCITW